MKAYKMKDLRKACLIEGGEMKYLGNEILVNSKCRENNGLLKTVFSIRRTMVRRVVKRFWIELSR
jgi:hypothetical protein